MADRKENELTKANNFAYVRALDSKGNSIQISKSDLVSVLEGLRKNYPYVIRYQNTTGKNTFYIKVTGLTYGIILFSTTKNNDAPYVITARTGTSATDIYVGGVNGSFNGIKPCKREGDSALYFECDGGGVSGRIFDVYIYNKFKEDISYSIEDNVGGLIYLD